MEIVEHDLSCKCHRRREWIEIDGVLYPVEFSVDDPNTPPWSEDKKQKLSELFTSVLREKEGKKS